MKRLTEKELTKIANGLLSTEPYKGEFDNKYYRGIAKQMLVEAMQLALAAAQENEE